LIVLAACVVVPLAFTIHAYLAKTIEPWGRALSLPFWFAGAVMLGAGICLCLLLHPSRAWALWARGSGLAGLVLLALSIEIAQSAYARAEYRRPTEVNAVCKRNVKFLAAALAKCAVEHGVFPASGDWLEAISPYVPGHDVRVFQNCPAAADLRFAYAYNIALSGLAYSSLEDPGRTIVVFESDLKVRAAGIPELLPDKPRHLGGDNYGFADGHVQWIKRKKLPNGSWAKEPDADWVIWKPVLKKSEEDHQ
jgi:prepilin-type processing-associated H-X9-DG protein